MVWALSDRCETVSAFDARYCASRTGVSGVAVGSLSKCCGFRFLVGTPRAVAFTAQDVGVVPAKGWVLSSSVDGVLQGLGV